MTAERYRTHIKLCAVLAERNLQRVAELEAAGQIEKAGLRRDVVALHAVHAFDLSRGMVNDRPMRSLICERQGQGAHA